MTVKDYQTSGKVVRLKSICPFRRAKYETPMVAQSLKLALQAFRKLEGQDYQNWKGFVQHFDVSVFFLASGYQYVFPGLQAFYSGSGGIKDHTSSNTRGVVEFYLCSHSSCNDHKLIEYLSMSFETGESINSLVRDLTAEPSVSKKLTISSQMKCKCS